MEKTFIIIKPDAVQRGLVGNITNRLEQKGLKLVAIKMTQLSGEILKEHYAHLVDKPFFHAIEEFMKSSPVVMQVWEGYKAIETVRTLCGVTNAREATPGSIRGDLSCSYGSNVIHASDSKESAEEEIKRFFSEAEVYTYDKIIEKYSYSEDERN